MKLLSTRATFFHLHRGFCNKGTIPEKNSNFRKSLVDKNIHHLKTKRLHEPCEHFWKETYHWYFCKTSDQSVLFFAKRSKFASYFSQAKRRYEFTVGWKLSKARKNDLQTNRKQDTACEVSFSLSRLLRQAAPSIFQRSFSTTQHRKICRIIQSKYKWAERQVERVSKKK